MANVVIRKVGHPTRTPGVAASKRLNVLVTPAEMDAIDRARGTLTRADYVRALVIPGDTE